MYLTRSNGDIVSTKSGRVLKHNKSGSGYSYVTLRIDGKSVNNYVHRLVAEKYLSNPHNLPTVNHIDGNKDNNNVSNLEWCSYAYNMQHAIDTGLFNPSDKGNRVRCIDTGIEYRNAVDAENNTEANRYVIAKCCKGLKKTSGSLRWEYV